MTSAAKSTRSLGAVEPRNVPAMVQIIPQIRESRSVSMCNLYSQPKSQDAIRHAFDAILEEGEDLIDTTGNLPPMPGV